jgi:hypothetical protein
MMVWRITDEAARESPNPGPAPLPNMLPERHVNLNDLTAAFTAPERRLRNQCLDAHWFDGPADASRRSVHGPAGAIRQSTQRPPLAGNVDRYAVGVPAAGAPAAAGVTGGGGGGVIGAQALAGGGPSGIVNAYAVAGSSRKTAPSPLLAPTAGKAT